MEISVTVYKKVCPWCKKDYITKARNQRFCSTDHGTLYNSKKKQRKKQYDANKELNRLYSRSHSMAVEVVNQLIKLGLRTQCCDTAECEETEKLEVHHKDFNWLNNCPSNLAQHCKPHHAKEHSNISKDLNEKGLLVEEILHFEYLVIYKRTGKNK